MLEPNIIVTGVANMTPTQRMGFFAGYAHSLTIIARMHFLEGDYEAARLCNESVHRICGHIMALGTGPDESRDLSFITMLIDVAEQRGWTQTLADCLAAHS